jgi:hypothetical protein
VAELKTQPRDGDVGEFIAAIEDDERRADARALDKLMTGATKRPPVLWGTAMVGYGEYDYSYASGRSGTYFIAGWAPRKDKITIYLPAGYDQGANQIFSDLLAALGPHKGTRSCLHIKRLADIDLTVLRRLIAESVKQAKKIHVTR